MIYVNGIAVSDSNIYSSSTNSAKTKTSFDSYLQQEEVSINTTSLDNIFTKASNTYGVSSDLLKAIAKTESNFDSNAVSGCGAQGIMQLMPCACEDAGVTDPFDPEQNIMGGAKIISNLLNKYNGDTSLALAAYNAGAGNVDKYNGIPPFTETQNYVSRVLSFMSEGVSVPKETITTATNNQYSSSTTAAIGTSSILPTAENLSSTIKNSLFSYDQYMKFLSIYNSLLDASALYEDSSTNENREANIFDSISENITTSSNSKSSPASYGLYENINYNNAVLNLFK